MAFIPSQVNNFACFLGSTGNLIGIADITLPDISMEMDSYKGGGVAGTIDFPVLGQTQNLSVTLNFHDMTDDSIQLLYQVGQQLDCRGALQTFDSSANALDITPERIVMQTLPMKFNLGKFEPGQKSQMSVELTVTALSLYYNGEQRVNVDKANMIFLVDGTDYLQPVRVAIGF
jgi:P2 family phage contractile tail tube protein